MITSSFVLLGLGHFGLNVFDLLNIKLGDKTQDSAMNISTLSAVVDIFAY